VSVALVVGAWSFALIAHAQAPPPAAPATSSPSAAASADGDPDPFARAMALSAEGRHREAVPLLDAALEAARAEGREGDEAETLAQLASALYAVGDHAAARQRADATLVLAGRRQDSPMLGRMHLLVSILEEAAGRNDVARERAQQGIEAFRRAGHVRGTIQATLQSVRVSALPTDETRRLLEGAAADARALGDTALEARALHSLGDQLFTAGELDAAHDALLRARPLVEETGSWVTLGTLHNSLGRLYRAHGRLDEALAMQEEALRLHQDAGDSLAHMQSLNAVGTVHQRLGNLTLAREYTERALAIAARTGSTRARDFLQANLAGLLLDQGDAAGAAAILEEVIAAGRDAHLSLRHGQLSAAYAMLGRHADARLAAARALELCGGSHEACVGARLARARAAGTAGDAQAALHDLTVAQTMLEDLRARLVPSDFFRRNFHLAYEHLYDKAIALQVQQNQGTLAIETAERARARAFLDLLASRTGTPGANTSPRPLQADSEAAPATLATLTQEATRLGSTILAYWVSDEALFVWVVAPAGQAHVRRVPVLRSTLARLVSETSPFTATTPPTTVQRTTRGVSGRRGMATRRDATAWRELYDLLIGPVRALLPASPDALLTIVPHGPLLGLGFAALQGPQGRYLLEDYALHYVPAGALLTFTSTMRRADARTGPILVVADPALPRLTPLDEPLTRLPGARLEGSAIVAGVAEGRATSLVDVDATEERVRTALAERAVLHFATHAIVRDDEPLASYLALGTSGETTARDGQLSAEEVYGLALRADLVVLSACRSAGGMVGGDGVATFARAFLYAGAASLLASVWDVADEPTNRLVPEFYRAWRAGTSKAQALRQAQLGLLGDLRAGRVRVSTPVGPVPVSEHPVFWAGFVLFGEPE
jgi:CHAT domain-containing protein